MVPVQTNISINKSILEVTNGNGECCELLLKVKRQ